MIIKALAIGAVAGLGMFTFADYAFSIPDVMVSYETRSCVQVENYPSTFFGTTDYSCENMPEKFNHIWVK